MQIATNQFQKELKPHGDTAFPMLVSYERLSSYESGSFLWHWHPEIEITLVQSGEMLYKVNHCTFHLKEGDILFGNANALHSGSMLQNGDCQYISITFDPKLVYGFHESAVYGKYVKPLIQDFSLPAIQFDGTEEWHKAVSGIVGEIIWIYKEQPAFYELGLVKRLQTLWQFILENSPPILSYTSHDRIAYDRVREILSYIALHYRDKIQLKDIAEYLHLCPSECSRLFKNYMNISLFTFLQEYRIERSLEYLMDMANSISDVASRVGFEDSNYYSKVFTRLKGLSPREYRKQSNSRNHTAKSISFF
ncbi:AraC family transcriptional regulator [Blautia schinkii]|nr:AraC family transcriptional regulator [Blautia schinkii]